MKRVELPPISREDLLPANVKVRITTYISEDIYRWLKKEADRTGTPYQILLNQKLRQVYEEKQDGSLTERLKKVESELSSLKKASKKSHWPKEIFDPVEGAKDLPPFESYRKESK